MKIDKGTFLQRIRVRLESIDSEGQKVEGVAGGGVANFANDFIDGDKAVGGVEKPLAALDYGVGIDNRHGDSL